MLGQGLESSSTGIAMFKRTKNQIHEVRDEMKDFAKLLFVDDRAKDPEMDEKDLVHQ